MGIFHQRIPDPWDVTSRKTAIQGNMHNSFDGEIDLFTEVTIRIENRGHKIAFRKITEDICPYYDLDRKEDHPDDCSYCMGSGYMFQDYIVKSYCRTATDVEAQTKEVRIEIGFMAPSKWVYYLPAYISTNNRNIYLNPTHADYIIELDLDEDNEPTLPRRIRRILSIEAIHELRDKNGRIEYYSINCKEKIVGR